LFDDVEKILTIPCNLLLLRVTQTDITALSPTVHSQQNTLGPKSTVKYRHIIL